MTTFLSSKYSVTLSNRTFHYLMRYLQQQQSMGQPHVLLHVLHAKVDVRLQDALGAPSSKYEAVQRVLTDQPVPIKEEVSNVIGGVTIKQEVHNLFCLIYKKKFQIVYNCSNHCVLIFLYFKTLCSRL